jgi:hypothetical protein
MEASVYIHSVILEEENNNGHYYDRCMQADGAPPNKQASSIHLSRLGQSRNCSLPMACTRSEPSSLHPSNDTNPSRKREAQAPSSTLPPASLCRSIGTLSPFSSRDQISAAHLSSWPSPDTSQPCSPPANLWILNPPDSLAEAPSSRLQSRIIANPIYGPACRRRGRWGPASRDALRIRQALAVVSTAGRAAARPREQAR